MSFKKINKPVKRKIWRLLRSLPAPIRKRIIRSQFEICYDLSANYTFKLAESDDEIEQALKIVHDSYLHLGYIDRRPEGVHFNAHICLPQTSMLIIKHKDEVIGTMSLIPDSSLGLPSEVTWDLSKVKSETPNIAEVSCLAIKRSHKSSKGHLLLTLCKFLYEYCTKVAGIDGVVFAATHEVEPFYTDLLLFKRVTRRTGQTHRSVKGNRSTCCFLDFNKVRDEYVKEYGFREKSKNLFHFFTEFESPNFELPDEDTSVRMILYRKHLAMQRILRRFPALERALSPADRQRLRGFSPTVAIELPPLVSLKPFSVLMKAGTGRTPSHIETAKPFR